MRSSVALLALPGRGEGKEGPTFGADETITIYYATMRHAPRESGRLDVGNARFIARFHVPEDPGGTFYTVC